MTLRSNIAIALAAATLTVATFAAAPTPALAADAANAAALPEGSEPTHIAVHFGDLDISSDAGQARLQRRIAIAAVEACSEAGSGLEPIGVFDVRDQHHANIEGSVNQSLLSASRYFRNDSPSADLFGCVALLPWSNIAY